MDVRIIILHMRAVFSYGTESSYDKKTIGSQDVAWTEYQLLGSFHIAIRTSTKTDSFMNPGSTLGEGPGMKHMWIL